MPKFLGVVHPGDDDFKRFATLQSWLEQACINAGISLVSTNTQLVLDEVRPGDTDLQKWQKVTSWAQQLANGIGSGASPQTYQQGTVAIQAFQQSYPITFSPSMSSAPSITAVIGLVGPNGAGQNFSVSFDISTLSSSGVTLWLSGIPASTDGSLIYWEASTL